MSEQVASRNGYVCPEELKPHWAWDSTMEVETTCGQVAIVGNDIQCTIFIGTQTQVEQFKREYSAPTKYLNYDIE